MPLVLTEDQRLLADTARALLDREGPIGRLRDLRDGDPVGFSHDLWRQMGALGLTGIPFPEEYGGSDLGLVEVCVVLEAMGRNLAPEPLLSTVLLAGQVLLRGGTGPQKREWLPRVAAGDGVVLALAHPEAGARYERHHVATRAVREGDGWRLDGEKDQVLAGHVADALVVSARSAGDTRDEHGISLFLVGASSEGLHLVEQIRVDGRTAALVRLAGVRVGADALVGELDRGAALLDGVLDGATVGLCAEMLGGMTAAFERTVAYLKERVQFGVPLGSFQALKHRAARLFIELELCRSAVLAAAQAADAGAPTLSALTSMAAARCGETYVHVAEEAIQMHGGIGMTDEHDIGFFLKRAQAAKITFGDPNWHRDRWARLHGY